MQRIKAVARSLYEQLIRKPTGMGQILRKLRRFYYGAFRPAHIRELVEVNRQGECRRCGSCCRLLLRCPFLGRDSQSLPYCRIYGQLRPANCAVYPFDAVDAEVPDCGYRFVSGRESQGDSPCT